MILELFEQDIDEIAEFEKAAFPVEMQACKSTYQKRFELGHIILGYRLDRLCGVIAFSYGTFDPRDPATIPDNFYDWSSQKVPAKFDTAFIYNLGLVPGIRGTSAVRGLIEGALHRAISDGCHQVVGEGPIPSYAGNSHVLQIPEIRQSLDSFASGGPMPSPELLFKDPHLALYRRCCPCTLIRLMPGFLPADIASGGFRAMLFRDLRDFEVELLGNIP